ncbi:Hsp70 family protein [Microbacterium memoriense]|uniref:Hsp70 family protein n=1 Tax=Microbacterium memoriense TaxID=2978350 RepID=A0ABT2PDC3_9MICO|nr:Hsp70 family protein [Microbacterium memoriense]MCT9002611.1 Hsp70 family protein [Microbacterium memoriense]
MSIIGIDLGTTNSAVATTNSMGITSTIAGRDGVRIVPSVVYFDPAGDVVVGTRAKSMAVMEPQRVAMLFKRGMGEPTFLGDGSDFVVDGKIWRPEELSSLVLKKMKTMAEEELGHPVSGAIVTVPAYFGELERAATRDAAALAGLPLIRIINEPTAAAIAHGLDSDARARNILVFDLGGGTFDVTVMRIEATGEMTVLSTGGNHKLGGADFDSAIVELMAERAQAEVGADILAEDWMLSDARDKAEEIKKELSTVDSVSRPLQTGGRPFMFTLTRAEFERAIEDTIQDVGDTTEVTLDDSGLSVDDIDTVLMVGGSARVPAFAALLEKMFGKVPTFSRNLDEDVARGASILATKVSGTADPRSELAALAIPTDIASHGLGVTVNNEAGEEINGLVVQAGTPVPARSSETFYAASDGQTEVYLRINEGDEEDLAFCRLLGTGNASFGRPVPAGYPIRIDISYNEEQIVEVSAFDGETNARIGEVRIRREGTLSDDDRRAAYAAIEAKGIS